MPPPLPAGDTPPRDEDGLMAVLSAEEREAYEQLPEGARNALLQQLNQSSGTTGAGPPPLPSGKPPQAPQDQLRGKAQFQDLSPALQEALLDRAEKKLERKPRLSLEERLERLPEDQRQEVLDELGEVPE